MDFPKYLDRFISAQPDELDLLVKEFKNAFLKSGLPVPYYREILSEIEEANTFEHDISCESAECVLSLITHAIAMDDAYEGYLSVTVESGLLGAFLQQNLIADLHETTPSSRRDHRKNPSGGKRVTWGILTSAKNQSTKTSL